MPPQIIYTLEDNKEILEFGPFKIERDKLHSADWIELLTMLGVQITCNYNVKEAKFKEVKKDDCVEN